MENSSTSFRGSGDSDQWARERLDSWKEVASFFRREVRTVQLWEKSEGLPIRRQYHKKLGSVYAYRQELEAWWIARSALEAGISRQAEPMASRPLVHESGKADCKVRGKSSSILTMPFEVLHSPLDRGPLRQIVDRFAEGLREDLVLELRRLELSPIVLPSRSLPSHGTSTVNLMKNLAREFKADVLLCASIRYSGNQVRVSVQMIRASDSLCLWSDRLDADLDNMLASQADLAFRISQSLPDLDYGKREAKLTGDHALAFHACAMGFHYWQRRGKTALSRARAYFEDAIELDPKCADAYAGLADTYVSMSYNHLMPARQAAGLAGAAVDSAMRISGDSIKVRNALINVLIHCHWDWAGAETQCRKLLDSGTVDGRTIQLYSSLMNLRGRHEDAVDLALQAHRLEPLSDLINGQVSLAYFYAADYRNALIFIKNTIELQPQYLMGYALLGRTQMELGNWDEAVSAFARGLEKSHRSSFMMALLAYAHAGGGDTVRARAFLQELEGESHDECFPAYDVSALHAILNQEKQAMQNMYRAYGARDMKTIFVKHDPRFATLHGSTGFQHIASAVGSGLPLSIPA